MKTYEETGTVQPREDGVAGAVGPVGFDVFPDVFPEVPVRCSYFHLWLVQYQ